jgi:hypothetical protein
MKCAYRQHLDVKCSGLAIFTAHDRRGCRAVCGAHALWVSTLSIIQGHSADCAEELLRVFADQLERAKHGQER